jgi:hypothetical protein
VVKKRYNAIAQLVCRVSGGYRTSYGLTSVTGIRATTKAKATKVARRVWRMRKELPAPGCKMHLSVEEAY